MSHRGSLLAAIGATLFVACTAEGPPARDLAAPLPPLHTLAPVPKDLPPVRFACKEPSKEDLNQKLTYVETYRLDDVGQETVMPVKPNAKEENASWFTEADGSITNVECAYLAGCNFGTSISFTGKCEGANSREPTTKPFSATPPKKTFRTTLSPTGRDDAPDPNDKFYRDEKGDFDLKDYCRVLWNVVVARDAKTGPGDEARGWCGEPKDHQEVAYCCAWPEPEPAQGDPGFPRDDESDTPTDVEPKPTE